ncbi:hypothetical protein chiPu_0008648 [Chiloscyllium punctatum]|uniref:Uncharacterized protein n=1 Tax=Chiloscyllium punctatum TaxID=137246 RepID=A0A401SIM9_CHIPU|nr:hypothetical protein [Chiloscyllium punctatum]
MPALGHWPTSLQGIPGEPLSPASRVRQRQQSVNILWQTVGNIADRNEPTTEGNRTLNPDPGSGASRTSARVRGLSQGMSPTMSLGGEHRRVLGAEKVPHSAQERHRQWRRRQSPPPHPRAGIRGRRIRTSRLSTRTLRSK